MVKNLGEMTGTLIYYFFQLLNEILMRQVVQLFNQFVRLLYKRVTSSPS